MRRLSPILLTVVAIAGCGSSGQATSSTASTASTASSASTPTSASATASCRRVPVPSPKGEGHLPAPHVRLDPAKSYTVTVATNCGTFAFALDAKTAPRTSASFYYLVRRRFFDGLIFHRVVPGFVIQGGDPTGTGAGGPGYTVVEAPSPSTQYVRGDVAMAKTSTDPAGASGSQFFIVTAQNATHSAGLTPEYAVVGKVVSGLSVVQRIGALPTNPAGDGEPTPPVVMSRVTVTVS